MIFHFLTFPQSWTAFHSQVKKTKKYFKLHLQSLLHVTLHWNKFQKKTSRPNKTHPDKFYVHSIFFALKKSTVFEEELSNWKRPMVQQISAQSQVDGFVSFDVCPTYHGSSCGRQLWGPDFPRGVWWVREREPGAPETAPYIPCLTNKKKENGGREYRVVLFSGRKSLYKKNCIIVFGHPPHAVKNNRRFF